MGKNKLAKFAEMETFPNVFQCGAKDIGSERDASYMKGAWNSRYFKNNRPIVLELGCGRGEYTIGLAKLYPDKNFIGVDLKGARMWTGARIANEEGLNNVAFLRTNIEMIDHFFASGEVDEIWLTFPDPQMKKVNKRLTSTNFMQRYQRFLKAGGIIHLKTDSYFMYTYTCEMVKTNGYEVLFSNNDLYGSGPNDEILGIKTYYEQQWLARGITIKYLKFVLSTREQFIEPDVEIERDTYRSFGRNQRNGISQEV